MDLAAEAEEGEPIFALAEGSCRTMGNHEGVAAFVEDILVYRVSELTGKSEEWGVAGVECGTASR